jgi:hypothetical protein
MPRSIRLLPACVQQYCGTQHGPLLNSHKFQLLPVIPKHRHAVSVPHCTPQLTMPSVKPLNPDYNSIPAFHAVLKESKKILALCGAGLSAASGLPTFRGAGGLWRNHKSTDLATPEAFAADPGLVWLFYAYRRHMALKAQPNAGHYALAELARRRDGFMCLSQNVDSKFVTQDFVIPPLRNPPHPP